jgi:hypothetical protein
MTLTRDLNTMGLAPLNEVEIQEIDGGFSILPYLMPIASAAAQFARGFVDGFFGN